MSKLKVIDLYNDKPIKDSFYNNTHSVLEVDRNYHKVEVDYEWLDIMENTIRYLDNILRNPNRFIINEEEIVKIEQARRVTVESIRHLSRNTNLIQKIEDNGDVKPSKILNINKDESFNTYENRVIYTLINNMTNFVELKKKDTNLHNSLKDEKKVNYHGISKYAGERVNINISLSSVYNESEYKNESNVMSIEERIERLESNIKMLTNTDVYKNLKRLHVSKVIPPIKKTNLILKNTNFQYAMQLWNYLQNHTATENKVVKEHKKYEDEGVLKNYFDEIFIMNYASLLTLNADERKENKKEKIEEITDKLIEKIIEINADLPEDELRDKIGGKVAIIREKNKANITEIQDTFNNKMKEYFDKITDFDIWRIK